MEIHIIPYSHHDYAWTNSRQWHIQRYVRSFIEVLELMKVNQSFTWLIDNISHSLMPFITYCPEKVEEMKLLVKAGRIAIANGGYSLARSTYVGEETFIRNMVAGKKFFQNFFDIAELPFFYNADVGCGHSQLPQILELAGHSYYRFQRPEEALDKKGIPKQFIWKGLNGSQLVVSRGGYGGFMDGLFTNKNYQTEWETVKDEFYKQELYYLQQNSEPLSATDLIWQNYGCDDSRPLLNLFDEPIKILEFVEEWNNREDSKMSFSTPQAYFEKLVEADLPVYEGVLDPCELSFNTPIRGKDSMWRMRSELDRLVLHTESLVAIAAMVGISCPQQEIEQLWIDLFQITGHAIEWIYKDDFADLYSIATGAKLRAGLIIKGLCEQIVQSLPKEQAMEYVVFNTLALNRRELVKLHISSAFGVNGFDLYDGQGRKLDYQIINTYGGDKPYKNCEYNAVDILVDLTMPSMGFIGLKKLTNDKKLSDQVELEWIEPMHEKRFIASDIIIINNGCLEVTLEKGLIRKIKDITANQDITVDYGNEVLNGLRFVQTVPSPGWISSWETVCDLNASIDSCTWIERGPLRWIYNVSGTVGNSKFQMLITLQKGERNIEFNLNIDSVGDEGYFIVDFSANKEPNIYADIPFGVESRKLEETYASIPDSVFNYNSFERGWVGQFFAKSWTSFDYQANSLAIVSHNCSIYYNHDDQKNRVSLLLNRCMPLDKKEEKWLKEVSSSIEGKGLHNFHYSLYIPEVKGNYSEISIFSQKVARSIETYTNFRCEFAGQNLMARTLLSIDNEHVVVTSFLKENDIYYLRLYEADGINTKVNISSCLFIKEAKMVDFLGNSMEDSVTSLNVQEGTIEVSVKPWQIVNLQIIFS